MKNQRYIPRAIEGIIKKHLFKGKVIIIYGARQTGKTTLVKKILADYSKFSSKYINCDEEDFRRLLTEANTSTQLKQIIGESKLIVFDEAQRVANIGLKLKLLVDNFPNQQIIATGSSSFELAQNIIEPLTGRNLQFWLHPFSIKELRNIFDKVEIKRMLETFLIYGCYPAVVNASSLEEKKILISSITQDYLFKDILKFRGIKAEETVRKLLQALALQLGNEVSLNELANLVGVSKETIVSYLEILEKAFIIFKLPPFSRNLRKEIGKLRKVYFYDLGIRNALINNQNPLSLRTDVGVLFENFVIAEKKKEENFVGNLKNLYFWRTYAKQEIDLVEEVGGKLYAYEIKWQKTKGKPPKAWQETYPTSSLQLVNHQNFLEIFG
jgi:Predicted ATPase (AAA+ superfamily)